MSQPPWGSPQPYGQPQPGPATQAYWAPGPPQPQQPWGWQQPPAAPAPAGPVLAPTPVPVSTLDEDPLREIAHVLGTVVGVAARTQQGDLLGSVDAHQQAIGRMAVMAEGAGADAVVGLTISGGVWEIVATGTAVQFEDDDAWDESDDEGAENAEPIFHTGHRSGAEENVRPAAPPEPVLPSTSGGETEPTQVIGTFGGTEPGSEPTEVIDEPTRVSPWPPRP